MSEPTPQPKYTLQHIQDHIQLTTFLTGELPKEITVSQDCFNWFRTQVKQIAKNFNFQNVNPKDDELEFMGVKIKPLIKVVNQ
ncbi:MAG: hypothetical protein NUV65_06970 [Candidatus Roizmanbacteria bacterium]|nr:hypothetical protein [Candidatus Roizmanbacteria bacterium]